MARRSSLARGELLARVLAGCWRPEPPALSCSPGELAIATPLLIEAGVAALTWRRLQGSDVARVPSADRLRDAARRDAVWSAQGAVSLRRAMAALTAAGIDPLLAKGWAIAGIYPSRALRPYGDLDLYVPPRAIGPARQALLPLALEVRVDLQAHPVELDDRPFAELVARAVVHRLGGGTVAVLGPEDHLRLLCLHLLRHQGIRPLWLCDVAAALERLPPGFDWHLLLRGSRRRARWVLCVLGLAHTLLGARLDPPAALRAAARPPRWVERALLRRWGLGMRIFPRRDLLAHLREPRGLAEALRDRWPSPLAAAIHWGGIPGRRPRRRYQLLDLLWLAYWFARLRLFPPASASRRAGLSDARFERMRRLTI